MKIRNAIQLRSPSPSCRQCIHFQNDPAMIERSWPGLKIMSSGYASVRDQDGFCGLHQLYLSGRDICADRVPPPDARCNITGQAPQPATP
jgi:hypothetical protein